MSNADLEADVSRIKDYIAISNLQGRYNHYLLTGQWKEIIDLFARETPGIKIEMADSGTYEGFEGVVKLFQILGTKYHFPGGLGSHLLKTPIVSGLAQPDGPPVGPLYTPFDPTIDNVFLPYPPEPVG